MVENLEDRALLTSVYPLVSFSAAAGSVDEGQPFAITVSLSEPASQTITIDYTTADDTAIAGEDYTAQSGTITFEIGAQSTVIEIATVDDSTGEDSESFTFSLTSASGATLPSETSLSLTLLDTDGGISGGNSGNSNIGGGGSGGNSTPTISLADASANEGESLVFTVTLSAPSSHTVTVSYSTSAGTAGDGSDYTGGSGTLDFAPGVTTAQILVYALIDYNSDGGETFTVELTSPTSATLMNSTASGTIQDSYVSPPEITIGDAAANEGETLVFTVSLSAASDQTVRVYYNSLGGTAQGSIDYNSVGDVLTFVPGQTTQEIAVYAYYQLNQYQETQTFLVNLSSPENATIADDSGIGTIYDLDSPPPSPEISVFDATAGEEGTLDFTISLSFGYDQPVYVYYYTQAGTATEGLDYTGASSSVIIYPGSTSVTVSIPAIPDSISGEGDETFSLILSTSSTLNISDAEGVGTIADSTALPPIADDQSLETLEDPPLDITLTATSPTLAFLTYTIVSGPTNGALSGSAPNLIYTPNPDYFGSDSFTFTASNGTNTSNLGTVVLTVTPVNDAPIAEHDYYNDVVEGVSYGSTISVLANDSDIEGDSLSASLLSSPTYGTVMIDYSGNFTYTPTGNYSGPDSFTYLLSDWAASAVGTVALMVNAAAPPKLSINDVTATEGEDEELVFEVTLDADANGPFAVDFTTVKLTAEDELTSPLKKSWS